MSDPRPLYAIGDVHGRADLLEAILAFAEADARARGRDPRLVFLGDIVDRGPDSKGAVDLVIDALARNPGSVHLRGNHDDWFLRDLGSEEPRPESFEGWLHFGGWATLASYVGGHIAGTVLDYEDARAVIRNGHPDHIELFRNARFMLDEGPFVYVHAGIRPGVEIARQTPHDCMWIREDFMPHRGRLPRPVVHGHTINTKGPVVTENRISLDTGAYATGRLSTLVVDPLECSLSFHQTDGVAARVVPVEPMRIDRGFGTLLDDVPSLFEAARPNMVPA